MLYEYIFGICKPNSNTKFHLIIFQNMLCFEKFLFCDLQGAASRFGLAMEEYLDIIFALI